MHTHSQPFLRAAKRIEHGYRLPQATARHVAELAGFRSDRDLADSWISLGQAVNGLLKNIIEQPTAPHHTAGCVSQEVSQ